MSCRLVSRNRSGDHCISTFTCHAIKNPVWNDRGNNLTPSVVAFTQSGDILVGEAAKNQAVINRKRTILSVKRAMGSDRKFRVDHRDFSPEVISSYILKQLKRDAEVFLGMDVPGAVISVPAMNGSEGQPEKPEGWPVLKSRELSMNPQQQL